MTMKDIPSSFENALRRHATAIQNAITKISGARDGQEYAQAAFKGGSREFFDSEQAITNHYNAISNEARQPGRVALDALLKDLKDAVDVGLRINTVKAAEIQASMPLIRDDDALLRFVSEIERRDDYTFVSAAAQYTKDGKPTKAARAIRARLDAYEDSLSEVIRKTEKFISKALNGDKTCADGWADWITDDINDAATSYNALQDAISGENVRLGALDTVAAYMVN